MQRISRGRVLLALGSTIFVLMVPRAFAADRVRIGLNSFTPINAAVWIAEDKGLLKKYGIDAEVVLIGGASAGGVSSLIAGDVQFLAGAGGAVVSAGLIGADVVMIASIVNRGVQRVMARSDIQKPEELRGKRIGVTRLGAASHLVLLMMLRAWGMNPADVQTMQIGSSPAMMAALEKGGIDAAVLTEPNFFSPKIRATVCLRTSPTWTFTISTA